MIGWFINHPFEMGALIPSPEAGDASVIPRMKKCASKSFLSASERNIVARSTLMSASNDNCIDDSNEFPYNRVVLMEDGVFDQTSASTVGEQCQFPYYRSSKNSGRFPDAVLVKDVGVSCTLLDKNASTLHVPETKSLVKQLKKEYNDLSNITGKITMYTKDILGHLKNKDRRKHQLIQRLISSKHAIASQYVDSKGNLCLKLRLYRTAETQCTSQNIVKDFEGVFGEKCVAKKLYRKRSNGRALYKDQSTCQENMKSKHEKDIQTEDEQLIATNSSSLSTSSVYNYLTMRKRRVSNGKFNSVSTKLDDMHKQWNDNKDRKEHLKRCDPVIFTNWKEISKSRQCKIKASSVVSDESEEMKHAKKATLQKLLLGYDMTNNVPNNKFHTVNIRIVKQNKRRV